MNKPTDPAFPLPSGNMLSFEQGLSKRELFAALAMQGIVAHPESKNSGVLAYAKNAVCMADALLAELATASVNEFVDELAKSPEA